MNETHKVLINQILEQTLLLRLRVQEIEHTYLNKADFARFEEKLNG